MAIINSIIDFIWLFFVGVLDKKKSMVAKDHKKTTGSPKVEVGEIDTSAPFQSVKDAVTLFGEGAFSGERNAIKKPKPHSAEVGVLSRNGFLTDMQGGYSNV